MVAAVRIMETCRVDLVGLIDSDTFCRSQRITTLTGGPKVRLLKPLYPTIDDANPALP